MVPERESCHALITAAVKNSSFCPEVIAILQGHLLYAQGLNRIGTQKNEACIGMGSLLKSVRVFSTVLSINLYEMKRRDEKSIKVLLQNRVENNSGCLHLSMNICDITIPGPANTM